MNEKRELEIIEFRGHENVLSLHRNTIEVTKDEEISKRADCIIGVSATKACSDFSPSLKELIQRGANLNFEILVDGGGSFSFFGKGSPELSLCNSRELVLRKTDFVSDRTGALRCTAAAKDIPRPIVRKLQSRDSKGILKISEYQESSGDGACH